MRRGKAGGGPRIVAGKEEADGCIGWGRRSVNGGGCEE